ncbi:glutamyl aminopeptidase [Aerococcaceae bacterium WGS1372]
MTFDDNQFKLIKELTELQGTSGNEREVREYLREKLTPLVDEVEVSGLGNIFGLKHSKVEDAPRLMVASHMDEVGFMVSRIQSNGTLRVVPIGGWNVYAVSAQRFTLQTRKGNYPCVSSAVAPHLLRGEKAKSIKPEDIIFDAGFESKEEAESFGVRPGDTLVPDVETIYSANKKSIISKAWDNRYGSAVILDTLDKIQDKELANELIIGATVQEEVGLRGVRGAVHKYQPDVFIAVDCSPAADAEGKKDVQGRLGDGFLLRVQDPGMITHKGLRDYLLDTAETNHIPYQHFFSKGGTDAGAAHTMNEGIISGVIGVPARYIHGHQSLFRISDYEAAQAMLEAVVTTFDRTTYETLIHNS